MTPQLVFIIGSGRSGTTLLRNILERHPEVGVSPELKFFDLVLPQFRKINFSSDHFRQKLAEAQVRALSKSFDPFLKEKKGKMEGLVSQLSEPRTINDFFMKLLHLTSSRPDAPVLVEKTPANIFFLAEILQYFPQARFIHLVRNGRSFSASAMKRGWVRNVFEAAALWSLSLEAYQRFIATTEAAEKQSFQIRYEDLIEDPVSVTNTILNFIKLARPDHDFYRFERLPAFSSFFKNESAGIYNFDRTGEFFSPRQRAVITSLLAPLLRTHGYSVEALHSVSLGEFMLFRYYELRLQFLVAIKKRRWFSIYQALSHV